MERQSDEMSFYKVPARKRLDLIPVQEVLLVEDKVDIESLEYSFIFGIKQYTTITDELKYIDEPDSKESLN